MQRFFISGIGTGIGKTFVSAILTEMLKADYWKPVQAGFDDGTDNQVVRSLVRNSQTIIHPETYRLALPASPHIAAREEKTSIDINLILAHFKQLETDRPLIIEGAGGLLVPLNDREFMIDLIKKLDAKLILVSRNYLGSINHSLLTAQVCKYHGVRVAGWVFNDQFMDYEAEISRWTGIPALFSIPFIKDISGETVLKEVSRIGDTVRRRLLQASGRAPE